MIGTANITLKVALAENDLHVPPPLLFPNANWYERETLDLLALHFMMT
ncbi:NADH-quinone oxidoreductase subunit C [Shigella flexneri]